MPERTARRIALVGDYSPSVLAHQAIPLALERVREETAADLAWQWVPTESIREADRDLQEFSALWVVPASPYRNMAGALAAVRWARESKRPFLGTCGGFQHAAIEFARNIARMPHADHGETASAGDLVISPLTCSLVEKSGAVHFQPGSRLEAVYGRASAVESYHCNYGVNPTYRPILEAAGLQFTAVDDAGDVRAFELPAEQHPFFFGTLFQPERAALQASTPPLVRAFVEAACKT